MKNNDYGKVYFLKPHSHKEKSFSSLHEINSNFDLLKSIELGTGRAVGVTSNDELLEWKYEKKSTSQKRYEFPFLLTKPVYHFHKIKFAKVLLNKTMCLSLDVDGNVLVWGEHKEGVLGLGYTITQVENPTKLESLRDICEIALSDNHAIAINNLGEAFSWGIGKYGELGLEKSIYTPTPLRVNGNKIYSKVIVGNLITCFLDSEGHFSYFGVIIKILKGSYSNITVKNLLSDQSNSDPNILFQEKIIDELENEPFVNVSIGNGFIALLSKKGMVYTLEYSDKLTALYCKYFVYSLTVSNNQIFALNYDKNLASSQVQGLNDHSTTQFNTQLYYLSQWISKAADQDVSSEVWNTIIYKITEELHLDNILLLSTNNYNVILFFEKGINLNTSVLIPNNRTNVNISHDISWDNITYNEMPQIMRKSTQNQHFLLFDSEYDDSFNMKFKRSKLNQSKRLASPYLNRTLSEAKSYNNILPTNKSHSTTMVHTERSNKRLFGPDSSNKKQNNEDDENSVEIDTREKDLQHFQKEFDSIISNYKFRQREKSSNLKQKYKDGHHLQSIDCEQEMNLSFSTERKRQNSLNSNTLPNNKGLNMNKKQILSLEKNLQTSNKSNAFGHLDTSNPNMETKNNMSDIEGLFNKTNTEMRNDLYSDIEEVNIFNKSNLLDESNQLKLSSNYVYVNPNKGSYLSPQIIKNKKIHRLYSSSPNQKSKKRKRISTNLDEELLNKVALTEENLSYNKLGKVNVWNNRMNAQELLELNDKDLIIYYNTDGNESNIYDVKYQTQEFQHKGSRGGGVCNTISSGWRSYRNSKPISYIISLDNISLRNKQSGKEIFDIDEEADARNYYNSNESRKKYFYLTKYDDNDDNKPFSDRNHYVPGRDGFNNQSNDYINTNLKTIKINKQFHNQKSYDSNKMSTINNMENSSNFGSHDYIFEETHKQDVKSHFHQENERQKKNMANNKSSEKIDLKQQLNNKNKNGDNENNDNQNDQFHINSRTNKTMQNNNRGNDNMQRNNKENNNIDNNNSGNINMGSNNSSSDNMGTNKASNNNIGSYNSSGSNMGFNNSSSNNMGYNKALNSNMRFNKTLNSNMGSSNALGTNMGLNNSSSNNIGYNKALNSNIESYNYANNNMNSNKASSNYMGSNISSNKNFISSNASGNNIGCNRKMNNNQESRNNDDDDYNDSNNREHNIMNNNQDGSNSDNDNDQTNNRTDDNINNNKREYNKDYNQNNNREHNNISNNLRNSNSDNDNNQTNNKVYNNISNIKATSNRLIKNNKRSKFMSQDNNEEDYGEEEEEEVDDEDTNNQWNNQRQIDNQKNNKTNSTMHNNDKMQKNIRNNDNINHNINSQNQGNDALQNNNKTNNSTNNSSKQNNSINNKSNDNKNIQSNNRNTSRINKGGVSLSSNYTNNNNENHYDNNENDEGNTYNRKGESSTVQMKLNKKMKISQNQPQNQNMSKDGEEDEEYPEGNRGQDRMNNCKRAGSTISKGNNNQQDENEDNNENYDDEISKRSIKGYVHSDSIKQANGTSNKSQSTPPQSSSRTNKWNEAENNLLFSFDPAKQNNQNQNQSKDPKLKDYDDIIDEIKNDDSLRKVFSANCSKYEDNSDEKYHNFDNKHYGNKSKNVLAQSQEDIKEELRLKQFENFSYEKQKKKQRSLYNSNDQIKENNNSDEDESVDNNNQTKHTYNIKNKKDDNKHYSKGNSNNNDNDDNNGNNGNEDNNVNNNDSDEYEYEDNNDNRNQGNNKTIQGNNNQFLKKTKDINNHNSKSKNSNQRNNNNSSHLNNDQDENNEENYDPNDPNIKHLNSPRQTDDQYLINKRSNNLTTSQSSLNNQQSQSTNLFNYSNNQQKDRLNNSSNQKSNHDTARLGFREEDMAHSDNKNKRNNQSMNNQYDDNNSNNNDKEDYNENEQFTVLSQKALISSINNQQQQQFSSQEISSSQSMLSHNENNKKLSQLLNQQKNHNSYQKQKNNDNDNEDNDLKEEIYNQNDKKRYQTSKKKHNDIMTENLYNDEYTKSKRSNNIREQSPSEGPLNEKKNLLYKKQFDKLSDNNMDDVSYRFTSLPVSKENIINPEDTFGANDSPNNDNGKKAKSNTISHLINEKANDGRSTTDKKIKGSLSIKIPNDESIINLPKKGSDSNNREVDEDQYDDYQNNNKQHDNISKSNRNNNTNSSKDQKNYTLKGYSGENDISSKGSKYNYQQGTSNNKQYNDNKVLDTDDSGKNNADRASQLINNIKRNQNEIKDSLVYDNKIHHKNEYNNDSNEHSSHSNKMPSNPNNENVYTFSGLQNSTKGNKASNNQKTQSQQQSSYYSQNQSQNPSLYQSHGQSQTQSQQSLNKNQSNNNQSNNQLDSYKHYDHCQNRKNINSKSNKYTKEYNNSNSNRNQSLNEDYEEKEKSSSEPNDYVIDSKGVRQIKSQNKKNNNYPHIIDNNEQSKRRNLKHRSHNDNHMDTPESERANKNSLMSLLSESKNGREKETLMKLAMQQTHIGGKLVINRHYLNYFLYLMNIYMQKSIALHVIHKVVRYQSYKEKRYSCRIMYRLTKKRIIFYKIKFFHRVLKIYKFLLKNK